MLTVGVTLGNRHIYNIDSYNLEDTSCHLDAAIMSSYGSFGYWFLGVACYLSLRIVNPHLEPNEPTISEDKRGEGGETRERISDMTPPHLTSHSTAFLSTSVSSIVTAPSLRRKL